MTMLEVLRTLWRRRALTVLGAAATVLAMYLVHAREDVYWSQTNVVFLEPTTAQNPNSLTSSSAGLIATAGYVERIINAGIRKPATAANVTLLGRGIRDGYSVTLPDNGGQWSHNFEQALLDVQVTGPSEAVVRARLDRLVARIRTTVSELQAAAHASPATTIHTDLAPPDPKIGRAGGSPARALAGTFFLGLGLTVSGVVALNQLALRRGSRTRRTPHRTVAP